MVTIDSSSSSDSDQHSWGRPGGCHIPRLQLQAGTGQIPTQRTYQRQWREIVRSTSTPLSSNEVEPRPPGSELTQNRRSVRVDQRNAERRPSQDNQLLLPLRAPPLRRTNLARNCCLSMWAVLLGAYQLIFGCIGVGPYAKSLIRSSNTTSMFPENITLTIFEIRDATVYPVALRMSLSISMALLGLCLMYGTMKRSHECLLAWTIWFCTIEVVGFLELWAYEKFSLAGAFWQCFKDLCQVSLVTFMKDELTEPRVRERVQPGNNNDNVSLCSSNASPRVHPAPPLNIGTNTIVTVPLPISTVNEPGPSNMVRIEGNLASTSAGTENGDTADTAAG